ncbi:MAG: carbohydrate porin, partial [Coleofasciculus sp. C3-bin4]|nr:carbohydrate porin [Coleofasciculus sp. C3-bin4]
TDNTTPESTQLLQEIQRYNGEDSGESSTNALDQITNVTQLRDVSPGDWAYEALRSLVERYGCIAGYPDGTFRGNRAMSRYEFAAGLNACLNQIERVITEGGRDFVTRQEFETLQRLVQEFQAELTTLGTRVDTLEGRVGSLEDRQFSTTTKLRGEVIFAVSDLFGDQDASGNDYARTETVFQNRVRLAFDTSFTGKDLLRTRLEAGNITEFGPLASPGGPGANITREGRFGFQVDNGNDIVIDRLYYRFPLGNLAQVYLAANGRYEDFVPLLNGSLEPSGTGALSRFGRYSPIYRMGNQNQGIGVSLGTKSPIRVDLGYFTDVGNDPREKFGLFDGNHTALGQVTFQPSNAFRIAATYVNSYNNQNRGLNHGTGSIASQVAAGTGRPVVGQSYGLEASFAFTPQLVLSGWGAYTKAIVIETGEADVWNYGATLAINDLGTKGSTLGFVVGMEPKLTGSDRTVGPLLAGGLRRDPDTGLHIEGFYKFKLSNNILITPGVIWLTAPGHNSDNDDIVIGTLRTTFTF